MIISQTFCELFFIFCEVFVDIGFGERFSEVRREKGLNKKEFAEALGIPSSIVSDIENGKRQPSKDILTRFSTYFEISLNWLFFGVEPKSLVKTVIPEREDGVLIHKSTHNSIENVGNVTIGSSGERPVSLPPPEKAPQSDQRVRAMTVFEIPLLTKEQVLHFNAVQEIPSPKAHSGEYPDYMLVPMPKRFVEYSTDLRAIVVFNNLMSPLLCPGDVAIFQVTGWAGDGVYVYRMRGELYISHVKSSGAAYRLTKEFRAEEEIPYDEGTFETIGRVRAVVREIV
jgi:transcriptional regulator with XRE-family HTH domain